MSSRVLCLHLWSQWRSTVRQEKGRDEVLCGFHIARPFARAMKPARIRFYHAEVDRRQTQCMSTGPVRCECD